MTCFRLLNERYFFLIFLNVFGLDFNIFLVYVFGILYIVENLFEYFFLRECS